MYKLLFDQLKLLGYEQLIYYFAKKGTTYSGEEKNVLFAPCYTNFDRLRFIHKEKIVYKYLLDEEIDFPSCSLTHAHSLFSNGYISYLIKKAYDIPFIVAVRNTDVNAFMKLRPYLRPLGVKIMKEAKAVVFISTAYKNKVINDYIPSCFKQEIADKSVVIPNGIDNLFLNNLPKQAEITNNKKAKYINVIQVGLVCNNKNQIATAKACKLLSLNNININLKIVGKIANKRMAKELSKYSFVDLIPFLDQQSLISMYRNADVFVMPSFHETFGLVYLEAMSQGLPIVYTRNEGFDGVYKNGYVGFSVNPKDTKEIARAIFDLGTEKTKYFQRCISEARKYSWKLISEEYDNLYKRVI